LTVFLLLFSGLQITIITAAEQERSQSMEEAATAKNRPLDEGQTTPQGEKVLKALILGKFEILKNPVIVKKHLTDFVNRYFDLGRIPAFDGIAEDPVVYDQIRKVLLSCKLIDSDGNTTATKAKALDTFGALKIKTYEA
jgi:hypothetical protein